MKTMQTWNKLLILSMTGALISNVHPAQALEETVSLFRPADQPMIRFGADEIEKELESAGYQVFQKGFDQFGEDDAWIRVIVTEDSENTRYRLRQAGGKPIQKLGKQGYAIRKTSAADRMTYRVIGMDPAGAMYGALDLAEQVRLEGELDEVKEKDAAPDIRKRGVKFNIPLDARTPSYDDTGDAAQKNIGTVWEWEFWEAYLDALARNRYNVLTLWNPHPFPTLVRLEEYPNCALEDVCVTTLEPTYEHGRWNDPQGVTDEILNNVKVIKEMTMREKIRGAVALRFFDQTHNATRRGEAVEHLEGAVEHWRNYARTATRQYKPQLLARTRHLDWDGILEKVEEDVVIAREAD